jgi:hypothetical protein
MVTGAGGDCNAVGSDDEVKTDYITVTEPGSGQWNVITYDDFESGWGNFVDAGSDCRRSSNDAAYAHQGTYCARIRDNTSTSIFYHGASYNVSGYTDLEVEFWYYPRSMENNEDFWLQYYNGSSWQTVASWAAGSQFSNGSFYHEVVSIPSGTYNYPTNAQIRFRCDASGNQDYIYIDEVEFRGYGVGGAGGGIEVANKNPLIPAGSHLSQNYPNPFNPRTTISFNLDTESHVTLDVFNVAGKRVATLVNGTKGAGLHSVEFDASSLSSGIYYYRLVAGDIVEHKKMVLLK